MVHALAQATAREWVQQRALELVRVSDGQLVLSWAHASECQLAPLTVPLTVHAWVQQTVRVWGRQLVQVSARV